MMFSTLMAIFLFFKVPSSSAAFFAKPSILIALSARNLLSFFRNNTISPTFMTSRNQANFRKCPSLKHNSLLLTESTRSRWLLCSKSLSMLASLLWWIHLIRRRCICTLCRIRRVSHRWLLRRISHRRLLSRISHRWLLTRITHCILSEFKFKVNLT